MHKAIATKAHADKVKFQIALYEETFKVVFTIASSWYFEEAQDIVQSIFAKIFALPIETLEQPVETIGVLKYMAVATRNHCKEFWRKKKEQEQKIEAYTQRLEPSVSGGLDNGLIDTDYLMRHLTEKEAQVITLQFNHDLEDCEIREKMGLPSNDAVRQHRHRALVKLRKANGGSR